MVFQRSMLDWRGLQSICHGYMCIVLYMKLFWCNGFPDIYAQLEKRGQGQSAMGIWALCYIWNLFGVMVLQRSMLDWGVHLPIYELSLKLILYEHYLVHGFPDIYAWLEGVMSATYMCIVLYMKLIWCSGFQKVIAWLEEGVAIYQIWTHFEIYTIWNWFGVMVFQRSMLNWRRVGGVNLPWVYVHWAIYETYLV